MLRIKQCEAFSFDSGQKSFIGLKSNKGFYLSRFTMADYQVIARKYRPKRFNEVIGQSALVTTLLNAIKFERLAHAYLFCGTRGTGKTSIARIFAKALNCPHVGPDFEPCNQCSVCKEISQGQSLDVLEIDGASHRGIDDIRQINETVGFTPTSCKYKIYIIDEVHMLTKEAFNALLKTLEEPPQNVKFFFATTEPHKIPATILSRCQRFQLKRISIDEISSKLKRIAQDLQKEVEEEAIYLVAKLAEGSLRDAESLFDQILSYHEGIITYQDSAAMLGLASSKQFFELDEAVKDSNLSYAFELTHHLFINGKDFHHFIDGLIEHYRNLLTLKLEPKGILLPLFDKEAYKQSATIYDKDEIVHILEYLIEERQKTKLSLSPQVMIESQLLHILQTKKRVSIETLVKRLTELEKVITSKSESHSSIPLKNDNDQPIGPILKEPQDIFPTISKETATTPSFLPSHTSEKQEIKKNLQSEIEKKPIISLANKENESKKPSMTKKDEILIQFAAVELEGVIKTQLPHKQ